MKFQSEKQPGLPTDSFKKQHRPCGAIWGGADDLHRVLKQRSIKKSLVKVGLAVGLIPGRDLRNGISAEYKIIVKSAAGEVITPIHQHLRGLA